MKNSKNSLAKYRLVVDHYFNNEFNASSAYKEVYTNVKKDSTASVNFSRIKAIPEIKKYIEEKHEEAAKIIEMSHIGILRELKNYLEIDVTETIGLSKDEVKALPVEFKRAISSHKIKNKKFYDSKGNLLNEEETIELKFYSKIKVLDMINKHIGFYEADNKQKSNEINIITTNEKHQTIIQKILNGE